MIVVASHAAKLNGKIHEVPVITVINTLRENKMSFIYIRHSLEGNFQSYAYFYKKGLLVNEQKIFTLSKFSVLRYFTEVLSTFVFLLNKQVNIFIGVDPLNALIGVLLKSVRKTRKNIFYTADFTYKRFGNRILNWFYLSIDKFCVRNSFQVWNVSNRIFLIRQQYGVNSEKNKMVPNVPSNLYLSYVENIKRREKYTLITLGMLSDQIDYIGLFDAVEVLSKKYKKIKLKVLGGGPLENDFKGYVREKSLSERIIFYGQVDNTIALREISLSGIGCALYSGKWSFNYYGDSMKCREYLSFGLPVLTTNTHSTVDEISRYKAGVVTENDAKCYVDSIEQIFESYSIFSKNAKNLGNKYLDIHSKLIKESLEYE